MPATGPGQQAEVILDPLAGLARASHARNPSSCSGAGRRLCSEEVIADVFAWSISNLF